MRYFGLFRRNPRPLTTKGAEHEATDMNAVLHDVVGLTLDNQPHIEENEMDISNEKRWELTQEQLQHMYSLSKFRVKIKSLACEALIIRREERRRRKFGFVSQGLRDHRVQVVRAEQRATLLAYAYCRGKNRSYVEQNCKQAFPANRVASIVKSITGMDARQALSHWEST